MVVWGEMVVGGVVGDEGWGGRFVFGCAVCVCVCLRACWSEALAAAAADVIVIISIFESSAISNSSCTGRDAIVGRSNSNIRHFSN